MNTFYSYCNFDTEISEIVNGAPKIYAPHIMEQKLEAVKEILTHIQIYKLENGLDFNHEDGHMHDHDHGHDHGHHHKH